MNFKSLLPLVAVLAAGVLVYWRRSRPDQAANTLRGRGRLDRVGWAVALGALTAGLLTTARLASGQRNQQGWVWLGCAVALALLLALSPRLAQRVVPGLLVVLGLAGFVLARSQLGWAVHGGPAAKFAVPGPKGGSTFVAGSAGPGYGAEELVLLLAWLFVLLGGWLFGRSPDPVLSRARRLLGRAGELAPRGEFLALLLLPVAIMVAELNNPSWDSSAVVAWFALTLGVAVAVLHQWPGTAARLAVTGLLLMGLGGFVLVIGSSQSGPAGTIFNHSFVPRDYGAVVLASPNGPGPGLVVGQSILLLAFGAWLVPQTFPSIRRLLRGSPPDVELTRQVRQLTESRAVAVDSAASNLRRLERDLHDGAQARLVALGMNLRAAERLIPMNPDAALALVVEARETSAKALTELRELVRGVHPPVLADRGLADAVLALALDCPLAVETRIDLPGRPPRPVETACYFAVAELLTNAAKHSGAHGARIDVSHRERMLRIELTDFGLGGADPAAGTGLAGVEKRLAAFDGIMAISSPAGGPTIVVLEVPCALSSPKTSTC